MTEEQLGEQKAADTERQKIILLEALRIVNRTIACRRRRLQEIADGKDCPPIEVTGDTETDYPATVKVDPAKVCELLLAFDEPIYRTLEIDLPVELWDALANLAGLRVASSINVDLISLDL